MRHSLQKGKHPYGLQRGSLCPAGKKEPYVHYLCQATLRIWRCDQEDSTDIHSEIQSRSVGHFIQLSQYPDPFHDD